MRPPNSNDNKKKSMLVYIVASLLLGLSLFVRVYNLDGKFYWIDEVSSSFAITGHWPEHIEQQLSQKVGQIISIGQFQDFLEHKPISDTGPLVSSLLKRDPQHSPLYFILAQKWATIFGASPQSLRMASAFLSFLGIPIFVWLCIELFGSLLAGMVGLGIVAIAPFPVLFSQQNREYGMWFTLCALSTVILLLANRKNTYPYWVAYGFSVAVSLYTFLFSLPFLVSHLLFQRIELKKYSDSRFRRFIIAFSLGILAYTPWLINIFINREQVLRLNDWSSKYLDPAIYLQGLLLNVSRLFVDFGLPSFKPLPWKHLELLLPILIAVAIAITSLSLSARRLTHSKRILIISMFAIPILFLFLMDIVAGKGIHALVARQLMPSWMAIYLSVTFSVTFGLNSKSFTKNGFAFGALILVLIFETISMMSYLPERQWWTLKPKPIFNDVLVIESTNPDLLIVTESEIELKEFLSIGYSLKPELPLLALNENDILPNLDKFQKITLYHPSQRLLEKIKSNFATEEISKEIWLVRSRF
tara:strand:- start:33607 stop:35196 length:1590 start_codon:yes stop_codon:yes gene_type:complete